MPIVVHKRVTRWGNGLGIRLTKKEAERLRIKAGDEVEAEIFGQEDRPTKEDLDRLAIFDFGGALDDLDKIDDIIGDDLLGDL
ncbi:MAG: hypothetical protein KY455_02225 [Euryarchaeota archaeon]|nr:hypothetical protein [Euryarchaeota archaeon]